MTLNAEKYIAKLLDSLMQQTIVPEEIIVSDSESEDETVNIAVKYDKVKIVRIKRKKFDHGGSRDLALRESIGDYVLFFTQDVIIGNDHYIENILAPFTDSRVAMVCGCQVAKPDAHLYEKYIREFNYPKNLIIRSADDISTMGIKTFYMSDVCAAYRKDIYFEIGGFEHNVLTNEDMLIASRAIRAGYKSVYESAAVVFHSHNFSWKQEYKRNYDVAVFMKKHEEDFRSITITGEGFRLVKYVSCKLLKGFHFVQFMRFGCSTMAKYMGNTMGRHIKN